MVLCDPFAINVIGKTIVKVLRHLTQTEVLPRVCSYQIFHEFSLGMGFAHLNVFIVDQF